MAKTKLNNDPRQLNGMSIYHDDKRTVYSPFFSKKGYIITENNIKGYTSYIQGYMMTILVFCISYMFTKNLLVPLLLAAIFLGSTIGTFYFSFIKKAGVLENYKKPERDSFVVRQANTLDSSNIITMIVCCPLLAGCLMFLSYLNHYEGFNFWMMTFIAVLVLLYGVLNIYILIYKKNHSDE